MWQNNELNERLGIRVCFMPADPGPGTGDSIGEPGPDDGPAPGDLDGTIGGDLGSAIGALVGGLFGGLIGGAAGGTAGAGHGATVGSAVGGNVGSQIENSIREGWGVDNGLPDPGPSPHSFGDHGISARSFPDGTIKVTATFGATSTVSTMAWTFDRDLRITDAEFAKRDGSINRVTYDANNTAAYSKIVEHLNTQGQMIEQRIKHDSGAETVHSFDRASADWNIVTDEYDTSGARTRQNVYYDNGDYQFNYWDAHDTASWDLYTDRHVASGARQTERVYNDDGSYRFFYYDVNQQSTWNTIVEEYDTHGRRISQAVNNDDGSRATTYFDAAGTQSWTTVTDSYTAAGVRTQTIHYDDGRILIV